MSDPAHPRAFPRLELKAYVDYTGSEVLELLLTPADLAELLRRLTPERGEAHPA